MSDDEIEMMNKQMKDEGPVIQQPQVDGQEGVEQPAPQQ